jgi:hypothetical protein
MAKLRSHGWDAWVEPGFSGMACWKNAFAKREEQGENSGSQHTVTDVEPIAVGSV